VIIDVVVTTVLHLVQDVVDAVLPSGAGLSFAVPTGILKGYTWLDAMAPLHEGMTVGALLVGTTLALIGLRLVLTIRHTILP